MRNLRLALAFVLLPPATTVGAAELEVVIQRPGIGAPVFGDVEVVAEVFPITAELAAVELHVDGRFVGILEERPLRWLVDVGQDNRAHQFLVVARDHTGAAAQAALTTPRLHTDAELDVELHQLFVTVERSDGSRVLDLPRESFTVREDGRAISLVTFERGDVPFTAVLAIDSSDSMRGAPLRSALAGARAFVDGMRDLDEAKILLASDRLLHETPFSSFSSVLTVGLAGVEASGGTAIADHLYLALRRLAGRQGRSVVVLLSDGIDVESVLSMADLLPTIERSDAVIYWLRMQHRGVPRGELSSMWRNPADHAAELQLLELAVTTSGGRIVPVTSIDQVGPAFASVLRELRDQYVLGYYPPQGTRAGTHRIDVRVDGAFGARVRVRRERVD